MINPTEMIEELIIIQFGLKMNIFGQDRLIQFVDQLIIKEDN